MPRIQIEAGNYALDVLEWLADTGHEEFRRWLRENAELEDDVHIHVQVDFQTRAVTITASDSPS